LVGLFEFRMETERIYVELDARGPQKRSCDIEAVPSRGRLPSHYAAFRTDGA